MFKEQFYSDQSITALTSSFVFFPFGHQSCVFTLANDDEDGSTNVVIMSFDGNGVGGQILANEEITWDNTKANGLWLKAVGTPNYRLFSTYQRA